ncbi:MAG: EamA family transporter RarD [Paracoccus sp. (in: a-proteobacteria)]|nr:EamA family transporter RarD [Paracoccus sp. (in: a-proteobacteria)]
MAGASDNQTDSPRGLLYGIAAYGLWGFLPLYMKQIEHIPPVEIIAHRIIWSLPIAAGVLLWQRRGGQLVEAVRRPRLLAMAGLTAVLISINWLIYVWAIANDQAVEAALGYYINPLFSILLGALLLGERLDRTQIVAVLLAASGVALLTLMAGSLPIVALGLTLSWGLYAYFKRSLPLGPNQGFTLEVALLTPIAVAVLLWMAMSGQSRFGANWHDTLFLLFCGPVTAIPLMFYANGAKLVRLSTMGILQYIAPTMIFLTALFLFNEPFDRARALAFPLIWAALVVYSWTLLRSARARRRLAALPETKRHH